MRIVDYQSHRRVRKPRLRIAVFNIPEKNCPLERQIYEIASDIFCTCFFNDSLKYFSPYVRRLSGEWGRWGAIMGANKAHLLRNISAVSHM